MSFLKKVLLFISVSFFVLGANVSYAFSPLTAYFFWQEGCPHCSKEEKFFESIKSKYPQLTIKDYEVGKNRDNALILQKVGKELNVNIAGVPFLVIGNKEFVGFDETNSPKEIESRIKECLSASCPDSLASIVGLDSRTEEEKKGINSNNEDSSNPEGAEENNDGKKINVPFLGEISVLSVSLPVLTVVIGVLDGFNPCAMWTLLFLITLLLGMKDKKRMWILGSAFIISSALVYFLFMVGWLQLIIFLGVTAWVKIIIGLIALVAGGYSLKDYLENKNGGCKIEKDEKQKAVFDKLKAITKKENFWLALFGIILLAFAVNLVELMCSAGFPAMYIQVLALSNLPSWQYYVYIGFYIFFFMLDDMIVFFTAMIALEITGVTTKFDRASKLVGGLLMLIIGILLILKPEWLMFG